MRGVVVLMAVVLLAALLPVEPASAQVPYLGTPPRVVVAMLKAVRVDEDDVVYDLGSGDGRIVIEAAKRFGARGVGVEYDPQLVRIARANAEAAGVADRVRFIQQDMFAVDLSEATVVTLYLVPDFIRRLRPKLLAELSPGARIVSHNYHIGDEWPPERKLRVGTRRLFVWTVPPRDEQPAVAGHGGKR